MQFFDALRRSWEPGLKAGTRSVKEGIPTQSVGTSMN